MAGIFCCSLTHLGGESLMNAIDNYLDELNSLLETNKKHKLEILGEVREHLLDSTAEKISQGTPGSQAEDEAVHAFGSVNLVAGGFNACEGAKATKRAPIIALSTGTLVLVTFLIAAWSPPRNMLSASILQQITFFLGVVSIQVAVAAGICGASRALSLWKSLENSGIDRAFIKRALKISLVSLQVGVAAISLNFIIDSIQNKNPNRAALVLSMVVMIAGSIAGLVALTKLKINSFFEFQEGYSVYSPRILSFGERAIGTIKRHPTAPLLLIAILSGLSGMNKAETSTLPQALPWGVAEVVATILGFFLLGPYLGLREPRAESSALN